MHELIQSGVSLGVHSGPKPFCSFPCMRNGCPGLALSRTPNKRNHPADETEFMDWLMPDREAVGLLEFAHWPEARQS